MKKTEVRDQVSLPIRRCVQLCIRGIRYRLFRSAVTVAIVTLAVAFLMTMLSTSYVDREVTEDVRRRTAGRRLHAEWVDKLSPEMSSATLAIRLASVRPGSNAEKELLGWGGLSSKELAELSALAARKMEYEAFLTEIDPGDRSALVGTREGDEIFEYLRTDLDGFLEKTGNIRSGSLPGTGEELRVFVKDFARTKPLRERILTGHAQAVSGLAEEMKDVPLMSIFLGEQAEAIAKLARHGFLLDSADFSTLQREADIQADAEKILALLAEGRMRGVMARRAKVKVQDITPKHVLKIVSSKRGARWIREEVEATRKSTTKKIQQTKQQLTLLAELLKLGEQEILDLAAKKAPKLAELLQITQIRQAVAGQLGEKEYDLKPEQIFDAVGGLEKATWLKGQMQAARDRLSLNRRGLEEGQLQPLLLTEERIVEVAETWREQESLARVEAALPAETGTGRQWLGFSSRTGWLIIISFVVCAVGVTNAMLMSVTERFREIATMKCLGALDSFIMISFVLESSLQGLAGGLVGVVIGFVLGTLRSCWGFGLLAVMNLPVMLLLASAGACLVAGMVLAAMAALYPAWVAARLAPMEAMRIE